MSNEAKTVMVQGRIVWVSGDLFKGKVQTVYGSQTPKLNQAGQQTIQYGFGLAVAKSELADPTRGALWAAMHEAAYGMFPSRQIPPAFAMKYKDGDGVDDKGVPFSSREGYPGALVFALTTNLPIRFFRYEGGQNVLVSSGIKCGDYVNVQVSVKAHAAAGQGKAGLYLNPMAVQLVAEGKEIINAPTGDAVFGAVVPTAPMGYVPPAPPAAPPMVAQGTMAPPVMAPAAPSPYPAAPAPHYAVLPQVHQPPAGGVPGPYPAAPPTVPPTFAAPGFPPLPGR